MFWRVALGLAVAPRAAAQLWGAVHFSVGVEPLLQGSYLYRHRTAFAQLVSSSELSSLLVPFSLGSRRQVFVRVS